MHPMLIGELQKALKYIKQGIRVEVGNGQTTLFWHHNWVIGKPPIQMATGSIPNELEINLWITYGMRIKDGVGNYLLIPCWKMFSKA